MSKSKEINFDSLRKFNLGMGFLHFLQGLIMICFTIGIEKIRDFKLPIWSYFLKFDAHKIPPGLVTDAKKIFDVPFAIGVALFLFLSAIAHFIIAAKGSNEIYNKGIAKGINPFRWYEYALSSSIMIVLIALLFGVYDISALIAIFLLNAAMNLFGLQMETVNQYTEKPNWQPFIFGSIAGIGPWIIILLNCFCNSDLGKTPWFVFAIVISYFVFFNLFPINMVLQYKKVGKWSSYIYGEKCYITLSLVAKSVLAWLVFFGVMQPN